ncbi:hypothetical protein H8R18_00715 [Nanchangia anserum]|nr:RCC1 domain-containing protein [Nanchangia anserum]QOX81937.1 hypothetical protein H8R18_00715 [Nanchangia anserum]
MNDHAQTGDTNISESATSQISAFNGKKITALSTATASACAASGGTVVCWGNSLTEDKPTPPTPVEGITTKTPITSLSVGVDHACASNGTSVWCWGQNTLGQTTSTTPAAALVKLPAHKPISELATDGYTTYATCSDGAIIGWGNNGYHQLPATGPTAPPTVLNP